MQCVTGWTTRGKFRFQPFYLNSTAQPELLPLQDPTEGVLLLVYTPRPPSIETENMLRCAYRAGLSGKKLDGGWNRACTRDNDDGHGNNDDDDAVNDGGNDEDDDDDADGIVRNRYRDYPVGLKRTGSSSSSSSSSSADRSCKDVDIGGGRISSTGAHTNRKPMRLSDERSCYIGSNSAEWSCAGVSGCGGSCPNVKLESTHLLEELSQCGKNRETCSCCGLDSSCGNCTPTSSADSNGVNSCGGTITHESYVSAKREPTRLPGELTPCGENGDYDIDGNRVAYCGEDGRGHCRRKRRGCCAADSCGNCRRRRRRCGD